MPWQHEEIEESLVPAAAETVLGDPDNTEVFCSLCSGSCQCWRQSYGFGSMFWSRTGAWNALSREQ